MRGLFGGDAQTRTRTAQRMLGEPEDPDSPLDVDPEDCERACTDESERSAPSSRRLEVRRRRT